MYNIDADVREVFWVLDARGLRVQVRLWKLGLQTAGHAIGLLCLRLKRGRRRGSGSRIAEGQLEVRRQGAGDQVGGIGIVVTASAVWKGLVGVSW